MTPTPLVSISCITYNHAPYIRECLDGFMMQQTNFPFEVLIHDDASTDGTADIIREYAEKYPDIIKPLYEEENQWVKGRRGSAVFNFPRAQGKYIALCEGDDYWTDPLKLQKQVDILERNSNVSIVFCKVEAVSIDNTLLGWTIPFGSGIKEGVVTIDDYLREEFYKGRWTFHTSSMLFRNDQNWLQESLDKELQLFPHGDMALMLSYLGKGNGFYLPDCCSAYRLFSGGYNSSLNDNPEKKVFETKRKIAALQSYNQCTKFKYHNYLKRGIERLECDLKSNFRTKGVILIPKYWWVLLERIKSRFDA